MIKITEKQLRETIRKELNERWDELSGRRDMLMTGEIGGEDKKVGVDGKPKLGGVLGRAPDARARPEDYVSDEGAAEDGGDKHGAYVDRDPDEWEVDAKMAELGGEGGSGSCSICGADLDPDSLHKTCDKCHYNESKKNKLKELIEKIIREEVKK